MEQVVIKNGRFSQPFLRRLRPLSNPVLPVFFNTQNISMKQMLLSAFIALCTHAIAQPTITNSYFPSFGDTLRSGIIFEPDASFTSLITGNNGPFVWDFSSAVVDDVIQTVYQNASAGTSFAQFSGADLVVIGEQGESYFNKTATQFQAMGYAGLDPAGFGLDVIAKFSPLINDRRAPLSLFDFGATSTNLSLPFAANQLPDSLFAGFPLTPDSIRVRIGTERQEIANAYGTVLLPNAPQPFEVLRVERLELTTTGVDIKLPFLGWVDLSTLLGGGGGGGVGNFLGVDTTITHRFYANNVKEEVALLTLSNDKSEVTGVRLKSFGPTSSTKEPYFVIDAPGSPSVSAYPNPAVEWVRFDYFNLPEGDYTLKIFSLIGNPVWNETYHLAGSKFIKLDLDKFRKGTYLYSLANEKGEVIGTKRLVVVKP